MAVSTTSDPTGTYKLYARRSAADSPISRRSVSSTYIDANSLSWVASASAGVTQNRVYRSSMPGGPYAQIGSTTGTAFVDTTAPRAVTSYYVVTAYNGTTNLESAYSNQASAKAK